MSDDSKNRLINWAQFRFSIIGALLSRHPTKDEWIRFGASTLERWYYKALNADDPILALGRKIRKDRGRNLAMSARTLAALERQYRDFPHWSYRLHTDNLAALINERPELGNIPSYSSVKRRMKEKGWYRKRGPRRPTKGQRLAAERLENQEVRSFEADYVHALWHLDFHEGRRVVDNNGTWHTPVALCVLDDRSRLCCHIQWYLSETAESLYHGLVQAFQKRRLPRALMTDNGSAMVARETENGLLRLGVHHDKTLPYSPYQNGKQESFWGQLEGRLLAMLTRVEPLTLDFLNQTTLAWVEQEYNRSIHEEIATTPLDRMLQGPDVSRKCPDSESLRVAFTAKETRMQRKSDGTIQLEGVRFEIPSRFRHYTRLTVCFQSWNKTVAWLVDKRTGNVLSRIYPQDKSKNAQGLRRTVETAEPITPSSGNGEPIPPLLRKILSDYAATGLPPAYIPKEERNGKDE